MAIWVVSPGNCNFIVPRKPLPIPKLGEWAGVRRGLMHTQAVRVTQGKCLSVKPGEPWNG